MTVGLYDLLMTPIRRHRRLHYLLRNLFLTQAKFVSSIRARQQLAPRILPIVIIVGCFRSGTSFTAHALSSAGLTFPGKLGGPNELDRLGAFEDEQHVVPINDDILRGSGGDSYRPPANLRIYAYQRAQIVQAFAWLCSFDGISGWKDPRATLTLPAWLDVARKLKIPLHVVGVFRSPASVANSIVRRAERETERVDVDFARALNLWCFYNDRLLKLAIELSERFSWFTVDQHPQNAEANLNRIAARIGLSFDIKMVWNHRAKIASEVPSPITATARCIHRRLIEAHARQWHESTAPQKFDADRAGLICTREVGDR